MLGVLIAVLSGALMSVQGVFNSGVTKQVSLTLCAAFVQLSAFAVCALSWLFTRDGESPLALFRIDSKYMLLGGVIGAAITFAVVKSITALGPAGAAVITVTSQVAAAYIIELFGLFGVEKAPFEARKLIGIVAAIGGIILFNWGKK